MTHRFCISLFLLLISTLHAGGQEQPRVSGFRLSFGGGIVPTSEKFLFLGVRDPAPLRTGYHIGVAGSYELGTLIEPSVIDLGIYATFSHLTTSLVGEPPYEAELTYWCTSLLLTSRISVKGTLSPFVEFGLGMGHWRFNKDYRSSSDSDDRGIVSGACSMFGAGLSLSVSQHLQLDGFFQAIFLFRRIQIVFYPDSYVIKNPKRQMVGLRIAYSF